MAENTNILSVDKQVSQLIALERQPIVRMKNRKGDIDTKKAVFSDLSSKLSKLRSSAQGLSDLVSSAFRTKKTTTSDTDVITATAGSGSTAAQHSIKVKNLAQAHALTSKGFISTEETSIKEGIHEFDITVGKGSVEPTTKKISIEIIEGDTNDDVLKKIARAIDASGLQASASVITTDDTTSTKKLVITSNKTGDENVITDIKRVSGTGNLVNELKIGRTESKDDAAGATSQAGINASFVLDGNEITSSSNVNSTALEGVTLNLLTTKDTAVNLDVSVDIEDVTEKVKSFLDDYNEAITFVKEKTGVRSGERGVLAGEYIISELSSKLRNIISTRVTGHTTDGSPSLLSQVGIEAKNDGTLSIKDSKKFEEALKTDPKQVADLFFDPAFDDDTTTFVGGIPTTGGVANKIDELLERFVKSGGILASSQKSFKQQISNINKQISNFEDRLKIREGVLRQQFTAMFEILSSLSSQQQMVARFSAF